MCVGWSCNVEHTCTAQWIVGTQTLLFPRRRRRSRSCCFCCHPVFLNLWGCRPPAHTHPPALTTCLAWTFPVCHICLISALLADQVLVIGSADGKVELVGVANLTSLLKLVHGNGEVRAPHPTPRTHLDCGSPVLVVKVAPPIRLRVRAFTCVCVKLSCRVLLGVGAG